jgi:hypothetical protein
MNFKQIIDVESYRVPNMTLSAPTTMYEENP